jgi:hypothetical protein
LQEELNREDLAEPDNDQISQDEAYALELQNELDQEQDLGEPNPAVVYGPQPQLDEDSDEEDSVDDSLDELPGGLSQQPGGREEGPARNNRVGVKLLFPVNLLP